MHVTGDGLWMIISLDLDAQLSYLDMESVHCLVILDLSMVTFILQQASLCNWSLFCFISQVCMFYLNTKATCECYPSHLYVDVTSLVYISSLHARITVNVAYQVYVTMLHARCM